MFGCKLRCECDACFIHTTHIARSINLLDKLPFLFVLVNFHTLELLRSANPIGEEVEKGLSIDFVYFLLC